MKIWAALAMLFTVSVVSLPTQAAFVYTDWQAEGDNKAVLHEETGIEWLRLDSVNKKSMAQILSELDTVYAGWRLPTADEVSEMMYGLYGTYSVSNLEFVSYATRTGGYRLGANAFANLFGNGYKSAAHHTGVYYDEDGVLRFTGAYLNEGGAYSITYGLEHNSVVSETGTLSHYRTGVFLVSDGGTTLSSILNPMQNLNNPNAPVNQPDVSDVSVPGVAMLGLLGLALLGAGRRRAA